MKNIVVEDIIRECNGKLIYGDENIVCENYCRDSRAVNPGDVYLGIKGKSK